MIIRITKDDEFIEATHRLSFDDYDDAFDTLAEIAASEGEETPYRSRRQAPVSVELPYSLLQLWVVDTPITSKSA